MRAILPLLAGLVPEIIGLFAGPKADAAAAKVAGVVQAIAGGMDVAAVKAAMADPAKAMELRLALAGIVAEEAAAERRAALDEVVARLADTIDARRQTAAPAAAGNSIAWGAPVCSVLVVVGFGAALGLVMTQAMPPGSEQMANILLGTLSAAFVGVVQYWTGSSAGSARKDGTIGVMAGAAGRR